MHYNICFTCVNNGHIYSVVITRHHNLPFIQLSISCSGPCLERYRIICNTQRRGNHNYNIQYLQRLPNEFLKKRYKSFSFAAMFVFVSSLCKRKPEYPRQSQLYDSMNTFQSHTMSIVLECKHILLDRTNNLIMCI